MLNNKNKYTNIQFLIKRWEKNKILILLKKLLPLSIKNKIKALLGFKKNQEFVDPCIPGFTSIEALGFIKDCVIYSNPKNCLEIGTWMGRSAYAICDALRTLGGERNLLVVDFYTQILDFDYFNRDFVINMLNKYPDVKDEYTNYKKRPNLLNCLEYTLERYPFMKDYMEIMVSDSRKLSLEDRQFQFCFIDGDHNYEGVRNDFIKVLPTLVDDSVVVFDDYSKSFPGVQKFINEIKDIKQLVFLGQNNVDIAFEVKNADILRKTFFSSDNPFYSD